MIISLCEDESYKTSKATIFLAMRYSLAGKAAERSFSAIASSNLATSTKRMVSEISVHERLRVNAYEL